MPNPAPFWYQNYDLIYLAKGPSEIMNTGFPMITGGSGLPNQQAMGGYETQLSAPIKLADFNGWKVSNVVVNMGLGVAAGTPPPNNNDFVQTYVKVNLSPGPNIPITDAQTTANEIIAIDPRWSFSGTTGVSQIGPNCTANIVINGYEFAGFGASSNKYVCIMGHGFGSLLGFHITAPNTPVQTGSVCYQIGSQTAIWSPWVEEYLLSTQDITGPTTGYLYWIRFGFGITAGLGTSWAAQMAIFGWTVYKNGELFTLGGPVQP